MPRLSVIVVTYNSATDITACLESIANPPPATSHETIIVDNASPDGTASLVRGQWPHLTVLDAGANLGFARASNLGIRASTGELILLLNPDTRVSPGSIDRLVQVLDSRPDAAVVGPRLVDGRGRAELSFGAMMSPLAELRQKILVVSHDRGYRLLTGLVERMTTRQTTADWVSGACLLVRRGDAEAVGLLDERYFMYAEDVDFCAAIRARKRTVLFTPEAEIVHLRGRSVASAPSATAQAYRNSQLAFYEKHHPRWLPILRAYLKLRGARPDTSNRP